MKWIPHLITAGKFLQIILWIHFSGAADCRHLQRFRHLAFTDFANNVVQVSPKAK